MRKFLLLLAALMPLAAAAEEEAEPPPVAEPASQQAAPAVSGIQIIDGKKFFPLSGARRQLNSHLSPSALAIMNHPRADTRVSPAFRARMNPRLASHEDGPPLRDAAAPSGPLSNDDAILSVFAPDDRPLPSMPSNSASPIRK